MATWIYVSRLLPDTREAISPEYRDKDEVFRAARDARLGTAQLLILSFEEKETRTSASLDEFKDWCRAHSPY